MGFSKIIKSFKFIIVIIVLIAITVGMIIYSNQTPPKKGLKAKGGSSGGFDEKWLEENEEPFPPPGFFDKEE